jgi:hypothetical protein
MAGRFVYDLIEPALLTEYVRAFDNEILKNQLYLERFLPNQLNDELEWRASKNTLKDVDVAEYRAFDTPPTMTGRQGWNRLRGELAPVSREIPLGEEEMLRLRAIRETGQDTALLRQIYDDAEAMTRSVQMRIEMARAQVLYTGAFSISENGLTLTADFLMSASHKPVAGTVWTNPAANILTDLLTWTQLYVDDNGAEPALIMMSRQALATFYTNTQMLGQAAFAGTTPTRLNNEMVDSILAANGLPPIVLYDVKARVNGTQTRLIPADRVLFLPDPSEPLGATHYGITAEAIRLASKGMIVQSEMPGIVAVQLENDSPVQSSVLATAIAVPVMPNPDLVISADVF